MSQLWKPKPNKHGLEVLFTIKHHKSTPDEKAYRVILDYKAERTVDGLVRWCVHTPSGHVDWPIIYPGTETVAYDYPYAIPEYVKKFIHRKVIFIKKAQAESK